MQVASEERAQEEAFATRNMRYTDPNQLVRDPGGRGQGKGAAPDRTVAFAAGRGSEGDAPRPTR